MTTEKRAAASLIQPQLLHVAWEITRSCNLYCAHCRASAHQGGYDGELTTKECFRVIDEIREVGQPMLILTGGEPLLRPDVLEIAKYAADKGLYVVMGTNGTLLTAEMAAKLKTIPVNTVGVSLDFPSAAAHDNFRCMVGAFDVAICCETLEHLPDPIQGLRELGRVCRGRICVSVPWVARTRITGPAPGGHRPDRQHVFEFDRRDFTAVAALAGLETVHHEVVRVFPGARNPAVELMFRETLYRGYFPRLQYFELAATKPPNGRAARA